MPEKTFASDSESRSTLAHVARDASVSMSTVSKVLNGRPGVSGATRLRVEELLHKRGYSRRGAESPHGSVIELVFEELDSLWSFELIRGVEHIARDNGMSVVLTVSGRRHTLDPNWINGVIHRKPVGVILVFSDLSTDHKRQLRTRNIPFVVIDPAGDPAPDVPAIGSANWSGGLLATQHLLGCGHRKIGVITGPMDMLCSRARLSGYRSALEAAGVHVDPELILHGDFHREGGLQKGLELLSRPDRPTAIFAGNDLQALGVYEAARSLGLGIPDDVSVVGYDDLQPAAWVGPPLTTIRQPLVAMAEEATRLVLKLRHENPGANVRLDLATSLVVRGSTRDLTAGR